MERIASGGMGEVYRAHDAVLAREVAIKVLHRSLAGDPGFIDRFRREARAAARLNHPNIVAVYDWGAVEGIYFMVMEFVRGESLREILNAHGRLEPSQAADALLQILSALDHAHRQGIVHRDMKPENVLVDKNGRALVADFGLARAYADAKATQVGTVTGTAQYLAPEQIRGEPADPRSDLYSLGIVAYELLTGRLPFSGETAMAIAYKHLSDRVPPSSRAVPGIPATLDGWVLSATERDRELRPESAAEMRRDLESEARSLPPVRPLGELVEEAERPIPEGEGPAHADTITIPRVETRRAKRKSARRRVAGVLLAILALAAAGWAAWTYVLPHTIAVPPVAGMRVDEARARVIDAGLTVRLGKGEYSRQVLDGRVLRTEPAVGAELDESARVVLIPSLGPEPVAIPKVVGKPLARARDLLHAAGFEAVVAGQVFDDEVPEDHVVKQQPAVSEGAAPWGSEIQLWVSKGPPPVEVPDVTGKSVKSAQRILKKDFAVLVEDEFSNKIEKGVVISQDPKDGEEIPKGSEVTIVVSKGPEKFRVESYVSMTEDQAIEAIKADGLLPDVVYVPNGVSGRVVGQEPVAGTIVHAGDVVTIYVA